MELSEPIKIPCGEIAWIDKANKIVHVRHNISDMTIEGAKEHVQLISDHFGDNILAIADIREIKQIPKEVRDFFASSAADNAAKASAILINSGVSKIIGNLFLLFNKPKYPTKLFRDDKKALEWLKSFL